MNQLVRNELQCAGLQKDKHRQGIMRNVFRSLSNIYDRSFARFLLLSVNYFHKWFIIHICLRKSTHLIMMMIMIVWHCVKSVQIRSFFWSVFLTFGMNTERYFVSLRIHSECGKIRTRKNSPFGHFLSSGS